MKANGRAEVIAVGEEGDDTYNVILTTSEKDAKAIKNSWLGGSMSERKSIVKKIVSLAKAERKKRDG